MLIGCECSGVVRRAFRALGHDAWSCDTQPADDGSEYHLQCDVLSVLQPGRWDLGIFHPPCTYLTVSGLHWNGRIAGRADMTEEALLFVAALLDAPIEHISLENPTGCINSKIRKPDQIIQPYEFGDDASKATCLWLKNLPLLENTLRIRGRMVEWPKGSGKMVERWSNQTDSGQNKLGPSPNRAKLRSVTYPGIAAAMAEQYSAWIQQLERNVA